MGIEEDLNSKPQQQINPPHKFKISDDPYYRYFPELTSEGEEEKGKE